jgi:hypothetical protein
VTESDANRAQLASEIAHWRQAVAALGDIDALSSPAAWAGLEEYLSLGLRTRLRSVVTSLELEGARLQVLFNADGATATLRDQLLALRGRYVQAETVLDFFGDAVATRSDPATAAVLRGLDTLAADSMELVLRPLGIEAPPVLVYLDKGLGASILKAGVRLWDRANPSPAAAIKVTRHNLGHPTALLHETGHQVAHLTGWNQELAAALSDRLRGRSTELADAWKGWASEVGADVYAFACSGWAPIPALANVVDGTAESVYRIIIGDPHPFPWVRVMFNVALCRSWFGPGPWDGIGQAWWARHPAATVPGPGGRVARGSIEAMQEIVDVCTRTPMRAFGGRPLTALIDPRRAAPKELDALASRAGATLLASSYLNRRESIRILAWLVTRTPQEPAQANEHRARLRQWLTTLGSPALARSA